MLKNNFFEDLFCSLNQKKTLSFSQDGFLLELEKKPHQSWISFSALVFQEDFLPSALKDWAKAMQQNATLAPYLKIDEKEMRVFLVQKIPCFLPRQMELLLPRFLTAVKRWSSLIRDLY